MKKQYMRVLLSLLALCLLFPLSACEKKQNSAPVRPASESKSCSEEAVSFSTPEPEITEVQNPLPDEPDSSLERFREELRKKNALGGILRSGYFEGEPLSREFYDMLEEQSYINRYPFLKEIPKENFISTDDGIEDFSVLCFVPTEPDTELCIRHFSPEAEPKPSEGEIIYMGRGEPVFIRCNLSFVMTNISISMSAPDGRSFSDFVPHYTDMLGTIDFPVEDFMPLLADMSLPVKSGAVKSGRFFGKWAADKLVNRDGESCYMGFSFRSDGTVSHWYGRQGLEAAEIFEGSWEDVSLRYGDNNFSLCLHPVGGSMHGDSPADYDFYGIFLFEFPEDEDKLIIHDSDGTPLFFDYNLENAVLERVPED
ncbi:MAG: hypothetical protein ACOX68_06020 [Candidatus Limivicinus sp.]|jgi:hypothetical protein